MTRWITMLAAIAICPLLNAQSLMVTNTNDAGAGSLRDAIAQAEANPGPDVIEFAIGSDEPIELSRGYGKTALPGACASRSESSGPTAPRSMKPGRIKRISAYFLNNRY